MNVLVLLLLAVLIVVFLAALGKHGWSRVMRVLTPVLAVIGLVIVGYLQLARPSPAAHRAPEDPW